LGSTLLRPQPKGEIKSRIEVFSNFNADNEGNLASASSLNIGFTKYTPNRNYKMAMKLTK